MPKSRFSKAAVSLALVLILVNAGGARSLRDPDILQPS